jgi:hypothetical protein
VPVRVRLTELRLAESAGRIVPNLNVRDASAGHDFYVDFSAWEKEFDLGWITCLRSPENRSIQVSLVSGGCFRAGGSAISVNVDDVDATYAEARQRGYEIVAPANCGRRG